MLTLDFGLLLLTAVCMSGANLMLKRGMASLSGLTLSIRSLLHLVWQPSLMGGVLLTAIGSVMWLRVLSTQRLSTCYPLFVSLTYLMITLGAFCFFGERVSLQKLLGLGAIVIGMFVVGKG
jgi:multidrug transporter EmrE-like cation transporter